MRITSPSPFSRAVASCNAQQGSCHQNILENEIFDVVLVEHFTFLFPKPSLTNTDAKRIVLSRRAKSECVHVLAASRCFFSRSIDVPTASPAAGKADRGNMSAAEAPAPSESTALLAEAPAAAAAPDDQEWCTPQAVAVTAGKSHLHGFVFKHPAQFGGHEVTDEEEREENRSWENAKMRWIPMGVKGVLALTFVSFSIVVTYDGWAAIDFGPHMLVFKSLSFALSIILTMPQVRRARSQADEKWCGRPRGGGGAGGGVVAVTPPHHPPRPRDAGGVSRRRRRVVIDDIHRLRSAQSLVGETRHDHCRHRRGRRGPLMETPVRVVRACPSPAAAARLPRRCRAPFVLRTHVSCGRVPPPLLPRASSAAAARPWGLRTHAARSAAPKVYQTTLISLTFTALGQERVAAEVGPPRSQLPAPTSPSNDATHVYRRSIADIDARSALGAVRHHAKR